jgi:phosphonoacetaldehyde hydrolase
VNIRAVVFDWAGTMVDHGSRAPVATLLDVFAGAGVPITIAEARESMGIAKKAHIASILRIPRVAEVWASAHGKAPAGGDVDDLYTAFLPKQTDCLLEYSDVIDGVAGFIEELQSGGIRIGSSTGYTRPMLNLLLEHAAKQGLCPDAALCPEDIGGGRPAPWMCWMNAIRLQTFPMWQMVKIGDTPSDIEEGRNAGMWTIGVTRTGNETGLTAAEWNTASKEDREQRLEHATARLREADYLVGAAPECGPLLEEISDRIARGERPH